MDGQAPKGPAFFVRLALQKEDLVAVGSPIKHIGLICDAMSGRWYATIVNIKHTIMKQQQTKQLHLHKKAISKLNAAEMQLVKGAGTGPTVICWYTLTVTCNPVSFQCNSNAHTCNCLTLTGTA